MHTLPQIRYLAICSLLSIALHAYGFAQAESAAAAKTPRKKTTQTSKSSTARTSSKKASTLQGKHRSGSHATTKRTTQRGGKSTRGKKVVQKRGQQAIDSTRARQIQEALIREHYMQGEPTGTWDATTQGAMQKFQADQGWQSKTTPDSRALIKLGLGPSNDHLLNPESAMTSAPATGDAKATTKAGAEESAPPRQ